MLDANVLYPALLRDVLLSLADADLYSAKWSVHIRDEWTSSLLRDRPGMGVRIAAAAQAMEDARACSSPARALRAQNAPATIPHGGSHEVRP
ncbi:hypothetical protein [Variovorax sp. V213]|uniref:hypothetical protein n=1 Tax=Variovorax sp. V213 TaxID=3065955 RepID=UPI0034E8BA1C